MKLVLIAICSFLLFSCSEDYKDKLQGCWETVKYEHYVNGNKEPRSELNFHIMFEEDNYVRSNGLWYDILDSIEVTKDSILFYKNSGVHYEFIQDTLIMRYDYEDDVHLEHYRIFLVKIEKDYFGIFDDNKDVLIGDWEIIENKRVQKDSILTGRASSWLYEKFDLRIEEDSLYSFQYPYHFGRISKYTLTKDSILIPDDSLCTSFLYELSGDTLVLSGDLKNDFLIKKKYVRASFDDGLVSHLKKEGVNLWTLVGDWGYAAWPENEKAFAADYPDFDYRIEFEVKSPYHLSPTGSEWKFDTLIIQNEEIDTRLVLYYVHPDLGGCMKYDELFFFPIIDGQKFRKTIICSGQTYWHYDWDDDFYAF